MGLILYNYVKLENTNKTIKYFMMLKYGLATAQGITRNIYI